MFARGRNPSTFSKMRLPRRKSPRNDPVLPSSPSSPPGFTKYVYVSAWGDRVLSSANCVASPSSSPLLYEMPLRRCPRGKMSALPVSSPREGDRAFCRRLAQAQQQNKQYEGMSGRGPRFFPIGGTRRGSFLSCVVLSATEHRSAKNVLSSSHPTYFVKP